MPTIPESRSVGPYNLKPGRIIGAKYQIDSRLGSGWEGEVYRVIEKRSGAVRAIKLFYPKRNKGGKTSTFYARKLERLRDCGLVVKYHHTESLTLAGQRVVALVSECAEGAVLDEIIKRARGRHLPDQEALMILHRIVEGLVQIHARGDYHGDVHGRNVLVKRVGVFFDLRLFDFYNFGAPTAARRRDDIIDCIRLFYDMLGGQPRYAHARPEFKHIIAGLRHDIILRRFPTAPKLLHHIETFAWGDQR
ncbi:MAG: protein kinase [Phycisphaeraceae bacterium]|nr:protein kinase [Phycisphaeraceae bacterium]MCB9848077.1 protein kinase [Phycisphaeraceae bacterium]